MYPERPDAQRFERGITDNGQERLNDALLLNDEPPADDELNTDNGTALDLDSMDVEGVRGSIHLDLTPQVTDDQLRVRSGGKTIKQLLWAARQPEKGSHRSKRVFIPRGQLDAICNFDAVCSEVRKHARSDEDATSCAEYVCGPKARPVYENTSSLRKIFAILVLLNQTQLVFEFQKAGIKDKHLPLRKDHDETILLSTHADSEDNVRLDFFAEMRDPWVVSEFYDKQWSVYVPFIARDPGEHKAYDYKLDAETIMPWTEYPNKVDAGGYADVRRIEIHPEHHGFPQKYQAFALKKFYGRGGSERADFERELKAFRKMPAVPHLVELFATFELEDEYQLLFPWANGGSLKHLWNCPPTSLFISHKHIDSTIFMHWLAKQAHGLMSGLSTIHELPQPPSNEVADNKLYGIHGDLKPENILHFTQEMDDHPFGRFKIADFGIIEFRSLATRTSSNLEYAGPASPTYRSPEHDVGIQQMRSRKVDIWSMGCVFSELLTWALRDGDAVELYRQCRLGDPTRFEDSYSWREDNFFCKSRSASGQYDTHIVKPSVEKWLGSLTHRSLHAGGSAERTFFNDFLAFILAKMLNPSRAERATCQEVIDFLDRTLKLNTLAESPSYWTCQWEHHLPVHASREMGNSRVVFSKYEDGW